MAGQSDCASISLAGKARDWQISRMNLRRARRWATKGALVGLASGAALNLLFFLATPEHQDFVPSFFIVLVMTTAFGIVALLVAAMPRR